MTDNYINFDEYIRQGEPAQRERACLKLKKVDTFGNNNQK